MIINNNRVQGVYIYNTGSESIEFTKDDLVISGNSIYVCDADVVSGIDPATDTSYDYFHPYPGSKILSASEYFQYIKNGREEADNKYVSSQAIKGILQGYQFGLDMEGVITDWINSDGESSLSLSQLTDRPIDNLMLTETLNRGIIKVSHELSQIVSGTVGGQSFSTLFGFLDKNDSSGSSIDYQLILSQYTYKQSENLYIRIQEMISPLSGVSVYRYMSWESGSFPSDNNVISSWRSIYTYSKAVKDKLDALDNYYSTLASQLNAKKASLASSFRFREIYIGSGAETQGSNTLTGLSEGVYTVCLEGTDGTQVFSESVVVRLKAGMSSYDISFFKLSGKLTLSYNLINHGTITLVTTGTRTKFVSVYRREVPLI